MHCHDWKKLAKKDWVRTASRAVVNNEQTCLNCKIDSIVYIVRTVQFEHLIPLPVCTGTQALAYTSCITQNLSKIYSRWADCERVIGEWVSVNLFEGLLCSVQNLGIVILVNF